MSFEREHKVVVHYTDFFDSIRESQFYEVDYSQSPIPFVLINFDQYGHETKRMPHIMKFISDDEILLAYGNDNQLPSDFNSS